MQHKQRIWVVLATLLILVWSAPGWADSDPGGIKCLPEQPSYDSPRGDDFSPKAGVHRNQVLLEIGTGVW
ncbi:MAG: hypothetical protein WCE90_03810 [Candidatus Zixiibacteriota bacterium]